jgi:ComF family protein
MCRALPPPFARASAACQYGGELATAVSRLKYGGAAHVAEPLGRLLRGTLAEVQGGVDLVVPVPLHARRHRRRGYNQAALLAASAARGTGLEVAFRALARVRDTPAQTGLGRLERLANVRGAFEARPRAVAGRCVLLVDDVMTTGATATACAEVLLEAGAAEVRVLALARAERPSW